MRESKPKVSWKLKKGKSILAWRERQKIREGFIEERMFEVSLEIRAGSGCAEMAGMTGREECNRRQINCPRAKEWSR